MRINVKTPALGLTPMTKAFLVGMLIGTCYGVMYALFQEA